MSKVNLETERNGGYMSQLMECQPKDPARQIADAIPDRPAILFAGQGSQQAGMGRDLAEADKDAMATWKEAEKISGLPLREIYWEGNEAEMSDTRALQPAITTVNLNLWRAWSQQRAVMPVAFAGHSLGEFSALAASGAISHSDALKITALRGRLMAEADPEGKGAMAAIVKLDKKGVEEIVAETSRESGEMIIAANYNTPVQTVISGTKNAIVLAGQKAKARKARFMELKVSGAFHSPMMEEANRELQILLERVEWHDPRAPVYCNVDAKPVYNAQSAQKSIWRQMLSPVYWYELIRNLYLAGVRWWVEISPRAVLGKMVGPSLVGIAGQCDSLRVDVVNTLQNVLQAAL